MFLIMITACSGKTVQPEKDTVKYVRTEAVQESDNMSILSYSGVIEGISSVALSFSSMGTIESILVSEGDFVSKGQLVAKLDPSSAQNVLDAAGSSLKQAEDAYERLKSIHDKGSLPDVQMVDIESKLGQAKSTYNIASKNLDDCLLYAPFRGVVGRKMAEAGENAVIGKAVITLVDISSVKISFSVPENEIAGIPSMCESVITVSALGGRQFNGKRIEKNVIANRFLTPTRLRSPFRIRVKTFFRDGMQCRASPGQGEAGIVIPIEVVMTSASGRKFVWCDDNGVAVRRFIETGNARGNGVEITEGLSSGDVIVTEGMHKISEGDIIAVR